MTGRWVSSRQHVKNLYHTLWSLGLILQNTRKNHQHFLSREKKRWLKGKVQKTSPLDLFLTPREGRSYPLISAAEDLVT